MKDWNDIKNMLVTDNKSKLSHIFMESFGDTEISNQDLEKLTKSDNWNLEVKINDVVLPHVDVETFLNELWQRSFKSCLEKKAKEMYEDRWEKTFGPIERVLEKATELKNDDLIKYPWEREDEE